MGFDNIIYDLSSGNYSQVLTEQVGGGIPLWIWLAIGLGVFWMMSPAPRAKRRI